jgi:hypothetical protein
MSTFVIIANTIRQNFLFRIYKHYIIDSIFIVKRSGFKGLMRKRGLKFLGVIVAYYLIRDTLLYVILPFALARRMF